MGFPRYANFLTGHLAETGHEERTTRIHIIRAIFNESKELHNYCIYVVRGEVIRLRSGGDWQLE